jgi:hypothetical protein
MKIYKFKNLEKALKWQRENKNSILGFDGEHYGYIRSDTQLEIIFN